jgi:hypothetical protein
MTTSCKGLHLEVHDDAEHLLERARATHADRRDHRALKLIHDGTCD